MDCQKAQEEILESSLADRSRAASGFSRTVDAHLSGCPECARFAASQQAVDERLARALVSPSMTSTFRSDLRKKIRQDAQVAVAGQASRHRALRELWPRDCRLCALAAIRCRDDRWCRGYGGAPDLYPADGRSKLVRRHRTARRTLTAGNLLPPCAHTNSARIHSLLRTCGQTEA